MIAAFFSSFLIFCTIRLRRGKQAQKGEIYWTFFNNDGFLVKKTTPAHITPIQHTKEILFASEPLTENQNIIKCIAEAPEEATPMVEVREVALPVMEVNETAEIQE